MARLSIIVPVYNAEKYLRRCIDSLLELKIKDYEIVLVDDGSTDNSYKLCDEYTHNNSKVVTIHKRNGGVGAARNSGILKSTGEWITFVDSDDYVNNTFFEYFDKISLDEQTMYLEQSVMVYPNGKCKSWPFNFDDEIIEINGSTNNTLLDKILFWGTPWGKIYNRGVIEKYNIRFNENISLHEDHCFYFDYICVIKKFFISGTTGYYYFQTDGSLSRKGMPPYNELETAFILLRDKINRIINRFELKPLGLRHTITFIYSIQVRALNSAIINRENDIEIYRLLNEVNNKESLFFYRPFSFSGKIYKILIIFTNYLNIMSVLKQIVLVVMGRKMDKRG